MSELPPSGAALDKLLAGGGEAELRRRYAADLRAAGLGVPSGEFSMQQRNISPRGRQQTHPILTRWARRPLEHILYIHVYKSAGPLGAQLRGPTAVVQCSSVFSVWGRI